MAKGPTLISRALALVSIVSVLYDIFGDLLFMNALRVSSDFCAAKSGTGVTIATSPEPEDFEAGVLVSGACGLTKSDWQRPKIPSAVAAYQVYDCTKEEEAMGLCYNVDLDSISPATDGLPWSSPNDTLVDDVRSRACANLARAGSSVVQKAAKKVDFAFEPTCEHCGQAWYLWERDGDSTVDKWTSVGASQSSVCRIGTESDTFADAGGSKNGGFGTIEPQQSPCETTPTASTALGLSVVIFLPSLYLAFLNIYSALVSAICPRRGKSDKDAKTSLLSASFLCSPLFPYRSTTFSFAIRSAIHDFLVVFIEDLPQNALALAVLNSGSGCWGNLGTLVPPAVFLNTLLSSTLSAVLTIVVEIYKVAKFFLCTKKKEEEGEKSEETSSAVAPQEEPAEEPKEEEEDDEDDGDFDNNLGFRILRVGPAIGFLAGALQLWARQDILLRPGFALQSVNAFLGTAYGIGFTSIVLGGAFLNFSMKARNGGK